MLRYVVRPKKNRIVSNALPNIGRTLEGFDCNPLPFPGERRSLGGHAENDTPAVGTACDYAAGNDRERKCPGRSEAAGALDRRIRTLHF